MRPAPPALPLPEPQADSHAERFDGFAPLRNALRELAARRAEWAGIPIPIDGHPLIIESSYPYASIGQIGRDRDEDDGWRVRNTFWSTARGCAIAVLERDDGKAVACAIPGSGNSGTMLINTIGASCAWGLEQEARALELLATLVRPHVYKQYLLTGMFLESSPRSRVTYVFRKLRPTVALVAREEVRILTTLCMHPIGYYEGSWGGAMCPTDDVIAHLMLMRGDESMFWRRCNQHAPHRPEAGL